MQDGRKSPTWSRFGKLFLAVMGNPRLTHAEKVLHACLAMHGPHRVRQQLLADETGMSVRNLQRCIEGLKKEELIQVLPREGKTLTYLLLTPDSAVAPTHDKDDGTPTTSPSPNPRHGCQVDHKRTLKEQEKSSEEKFKQAYLRERKSKHG